MMPLAYRGGKPIITSPIKLRDSLSQQAKTAMGAYFAYAKGWDLSGYLAGSERGGVAVQRLEALWCSTFQARHSIACNSATSAILAALQVLNPDTVHVPVMGMSAIAAVPDILGIDIVFYDIDEHYCIRMDRNDVAGSDVILAVNLFGHPAQLNTLMDYARKHNAYLVEDNAQGFAAKDNGVYAGTIGAIGIWSGNVHKPLNCGELGMLTTNDDAIAAELRSFINHGEVQGRISGLNLRLPEPIAVLALGQMEEAHCIVNRSGFIRHTLKDEDFDRIFTIPMERAHCKSAWYCLPLITPNKMLRDRAVEMLRAEGLPCRAGYVRIDKMPVFKKYAVGEVFPNADAMDDRLVLVELCSLDPTNEQINQISDALSAVSEELEGLGDGDPVRSGNIRKPRRQARTRARLSN